MRYYSDLEMLDEINILFKYLYMDEKNYIEFRNAIDIPFKLTMGEYFVLQRKRLDKEGSEVMSCDYDLYDYAEVVNQLKEQKSSFFPAYESKWEEIRAVVATIEVLHEINTEKGKRRK